MRETPISNCEKTFVVQAIKQNIRLDGRKNDEFRKLRINYGADWGSVMVALGDTKVLAHVSSELGEPKATRPNEGILHINVELGPMAAPHFESGRNCELTVQISRTLERTYKDSRCVDLESLCITSDERVWILRVDINVLNHAGNLIDCCSVATLCALAHYRRPDVSLVDDEVIIHTAAEKDPLPMVIHHYPVCVSYVIFDNGRLAVADPTILEEGTSESQMIFGINSFRELCCLNLGGSSLTSSTLLLQCSKRAANYAKTVVDMIKKTLKDDFILRDMGKKVGFVDCMSRDNVTTVRQDRLVLKLKDFTFNEPSSTDAPPDDESEGTAAAQNIQNFKNSEEVKWIPEESSSDDESNPNVIAMETDNNDSDTDSSDNNVEKIVEKGLENVSSRTNQPISKQKNPTKELLNVDSSSEEEETIVLQSVQ